MTPSGWQPRRRARRLGSRRRATTRVSAVTSVGLLVLGLSACGNWVMSVTDAGQVGITVDGTGRPVIVVVTCATARPVITMFEGRKSSDPESKHNVQRGSWQARRGFSGVEMLALSAPGEDWKTTSSPGPLEPGTLFVVEGGTAEDEHASLGGASFRAEDLPSLSPDDVQVNGKSISLSAFGAYQCS